jgi:double-stranded uracil-DNA glycosylase
VRDLNLEGCRLLIVGINPGLLSEQVNAPFARPGNRFWPALHTAGITEWLVDARHGLADEDEAMLIRRGLGFTNIVPRATAGAAELRREEYRAGGAELAQKAARFRPEVIMIAGIGAYRTAFARPKAKVGRQEEALGGVETWVVPNPSGLNAHETADSLARAYAEVWARLAGQP